VLGDVKTGALGEAEAIERLTASRIGWWVGNDPESKVILTIDVGERHPWRWPSWWCITWCRCWRGLCPLVPDRWLARVYDGLAGSLWAMGAARAAAGPRSHAQAALDATATVALRASDQDRAAPSPGNE